jgi:asparagine synthase (glutamine-hydrolysing)
MCGITGYFSPSSPLGQDVLVRMNDTIVRRGPDDAGTFVEGPVGLAMRRLSIIDVGGGHQPIFNEDGSVVVVFNGEIYNYRQLRAQLERGGHAFRTQSDTEVIVHLYEDYGPDFARHLEGMFAIALYDRRRGELHLARDRMGIKPLFVAQFPGGMVFGSEIKALQASGLLDGQLSPRALRSYLRYTYVTGTDSIYAAVRQLPPAGRLVVSASRQAESTYWSLPAARREALSDAEAVQRTEDALANAIESHLVADVPIGAFLSGGLDSGLIAALAAGRLGVRLRTFTVRFRSTGMALIDESETARTLAARYGLEHEVIDIEPDVAKVLPEAILGFDEPFADDSIVPSFLIAEAAARRVKVALTGLGGDELFAGYARHAGIPLMQRYLRCPQAVRDSVIRPLLRCMPLDPARHRWLEHAQRFVDRTSSNAARSYDAYMSSLDDETLDRLMPQHDALVGEIERVFGSTAAGDDLLDRALRTDLQVYLPNDILTLTDRTSMWHSLELRVPFLDAGLVDFAAALPSHFKLRRGTKKWLLRQVAQRWLPEAYLRQPKQGFESPMAQWLRGPLVPLWAEALPGRDSMLWQHLDRATVDRLWQAHQAGRVNHSKILFSLLMLFLWRGSVQ